MKTSTEDKPGTTKDSKNNISAKKNKITTGQQRTIRAHQTVAWHSSTSVHDFDFYHKSNGMPVQTDPSDKVLLRTKSTEASGIKSPLASKANQNVNQYGKYRFNNFRKITHCLSERQLFANPPCCHGAILCHLTSFWFLLHMLSVWNYGHRAVGTELTERKQNAGAPMKFWEFSFKKSVMTFKTLTLSRQTFLNNQITWWCFCIIHFYRITESLCSIT